MLYAKPGTLPPACNTVKDSPCVVGPVFLLSG